MSSWSTVAAVFVGLALFAPPVTAQEPASPPAPNWSSEWTAYWAAGPAVSVFHSVGERWVQDTVVSWGHVVTAVHGSGALAGRLSLHVEGSPLVTVFQRERANGFGGTPLLLRWNQARPGRWAWFAEIAGGLLHTDNPVPEDTLRLNFTAHGGVGVRVRFGEHHAMLVGYRFHHISNGDRGVTNPGVNSNQVFAGVSVLR